MVTLSQRVGEQARDIRVGAFVASVLVAPLWAVSWLVFWLLVAVGVVLRYVAAAVRLGWLDARRQAVRRGVSVGSWPVAPWVKKSAGGTG